MPVNLHSALTLMLILQAGFLLGPADLTGQASTSAATGQAPAAERALRSAPGGDTIAVLRASATPMLVAESGEWARVRLEGWMERSAVPAVPAGEGITPLSLAELRLDPLRYEGVSVRWRVQFVALQRADHLRSDMPPGAHYMLVRDPGGEPGFVYALVPEQLLGAAGTLSPLQRIDIVGRIRTGSSPLTGHPILDLMEVNQPRVER